MQRVLSLQMTRNADRTSSEFVSKRLCCSFLFSVGFLSLLGGFLLGRYATDRALLLRNAVLQHKQQHEEKNSIEIMNNISSSVHYINNLTTHVLPSDTLFDYKEFYQKLACNNFSVNISQFEDHLDKKFLLKSSQVLSLHLDAVNRCFVSVRNYLDMYLNPNRIHD